MLILIQIRSLIPHSGKFITLAGNLLQQVHLENLLISCSAPMISFQINCFKVCENEMYEYSPPPTSYITDPSSILFRLIAFNMDA